MFRRATLWDLLNDSELRRKAGYGSREEVVREMLRLTRWISSKKA